VREDLVSRSFSWKAAAFGLAVHTLMGGVALASAVQGDLEKGRGFGPGACGVFLATFMHKPADAMTITSMMLRAHLPASRAHLANLAFAAMLPLGALLFLIGLGTMGPDLAAKATAVTLAFTAGSFLCIALSDLLPELHFHSHDRVKLSLALLLGFGLMAASSWVE
jgi:zinc and cadmium transporter